MNPNPCPNCQSLQEELDAALLQIRALVEMSGPVLEELVKANPYDRRDMRFPSKAESNFTKALENCVEKRPDESSKITK